jgi:hypothetical protein
MQKFLGGAALVAVMALSTAAWADPQNILSDGNTTTVNSAANAIGIGNTAVSNSFNTYTTSVATQVLTATVADTTVSAQGGLVGGVQLGDANASVSGNINGISQNAANSGAGGIVQQGLAMAASAPVKF